MKADHDKCYVLQGTQESSNIQIANFSIKSSKTKKLLVINFDNNPKFDINVEVFCQKANKKLNALIWNCLKNVLLFNNILIQRFHVQAQFNYCRAI